MSEDRAELLDLEKVIRRTRTMRGCYAIMNSNSYMASMLVLAQMALTKVCEVRGIPQRPAYLELFRVAGDSESFEGIPTAVEGPGTVRIKWPNEGRRTRIDLGKLMAIYPFQIPKGARAYIPVEPSADGTKLIFRFSKAEFYTREEKRSKAAAHAAKGQGDPMQQVVKAFTRVATGNTDTDPDE